ncbi:MAG: methyltransferase domain-containing protein, partial [Proteobacteria bacterium]|nr:methyltransferase domain-containing protein [Pseudomonadota bacterium]
MNLLEKYIQPGKVYDVGAAAGFFMKAAKDRGWLVYGNEISRSAIDWARQHYGLEIEYGFLEELNPLENNYDAVVLWNTLEHTFNAKETLEICRSMLRDKGLLMIQVPDKMDEEDLIKRYETLHTYEFNRNNLPRLLEQMGFKQLELILQDGSDDQHITLIFQKQIHQKRGILSDDYKKTPERVLFVSWHGLGDNVMLTPALRKYKQQFPERYVAVTGLRRFGKTLKQLLSGLPFVDEVIPDLSDAWNDFDDYPAGVQAVVVEAKRIAREKEFTDIVLLPTKPQPGYKLHKIFRFADEVGIKFNNIDELQTELRIDPEANTAAKKFLSLFRSPVLVLHTTAGNSSKTLPEGLAKSIIDNFKNHTVLEFGRKSTDRSIELSEDDMELTKAIVGNVDQVVAIDSVIMHIAGAFRKPCLSIFTHTPIHQAIPLTYPVDIFTNKSPLVQEEAFVKAKKEIDNIFDNHVSTANHDLKSYYEVQYAVEEEIHLDVGDYGPDAQKFLEIIVKELPDQKELPSYPKGSTVLDLGCNTGYNTKLLAKRYGSAFGIDINSELIKNARRNNWMDCYRMDMHHLAFKDNFFDLIFAKDVLEHAYNPDKTLSECYRVIKPGGLLAGLIPMDGNQKCMIGLSSGNLSHFWKTNSVDLRNRIEKLGFRFIKLQKYSHQKLVNRARPMGDEIIVFVAQKPESVELSRAIKTIGSMHPIHKKRLELPMIFYSKGAYWGAFLTLRCTAGCPYCIQRIDKEKFMKAMIKYRELSGEKWLELLNGLSHPKGHPLAVIGGEPT